MKNLVAVIAITFTALAAGCGSFRHAPVTTPDTVVAIAPAAMPASAAPTMPDMPEVRLVDPLARALTSPTFTDHATRSLAIAGAGDPIFMQCVTFLVRLGEELKAKPLLSFQVPALGSADAGCPLCLIAAKRHDLAALQSGDLLAKIAEVRARANDIRQRTTLACAPLIDDERNTVLRLGGLLGF